MSFPPPTHDTVLAKVLRLRHPGMGYCLRCGRPWGNVNGHITVYATEPGGGTRGCFPLCEGCWEDLGHPEARIPYYAALMDSWAEHNDPTDHATTRRAVGRAVAHESITRR